MRRRRFASRSPGTNLPALVVSLAASLSAWAQPAAAPSAMPAPEAARAVSLPTVTVQPTRAVGVTTHEGVVEAVKQTVIAAQVAGAVVQLDVKVGDRVQAGQVLMRLDARTADQAAAAGDAQVQAARASLDVAARDVERQRQLRRDNFISQAALDRAEAEFRAAQAQANAQLAQARAARTQSGLHVVRAPYAGVIASVPVAMGDMAMPGRALATLHDPAALRVTAAVPQTMAGATFDARAVRVAITRGAGEPLVVTPTRVQVLPTLDAATHTVDVRADLPATVDGIAPGMFARVSLPASVHASAATRAPSSARDADTRVSVPVQAVIRRAELTAVYVLSADGQPLLRQVRLGRGDAQSVEVLAGLNAGERVVTEPLAAARVR